MIDLSEYITWNELCDRWKLKDFQLFKYLKKGLQPYSKFGNPEICPPKYHKYRSLDEERSILIRHLKNLKKPLKENNSADSPLPELSDEKSETQKLKTSEWTIEKTENKIEKIENEMLYIVKKDESLISWKYFEMPSSDWEVEELLEECKEKYFKIEEIIKFESDKKQVKSSRQSEDRIFGMFQMVGPQIEKLYLIFRDKFSSWPNEDAETMRKYVIDKFNRDRDRYNHIKREWLSEKSLYDFHRERHTRDDFIGQLLLKSAKDEDFERNSVQKIYNEYKEFKKVSTKVEK